MKKLTGLLLCCISLLGCKSQQEMSTFTNPLLKSGADPYSCYKDGYYYYTHTMGNRLVLWKTKSLADLANAEEKTIYQPPAGMPYSKELWAPEIMFLKGKWYAYFAADDGNNNHHRMYALENSSPDPMKGEWVFKGKVAAPSDKWAIDADVFEYRNQLYMIWSGWEGDNNGQQNIYIAQMSDPVTITGTRIKIAQPTFEWERYGQLGPDEAVYVNEGPQALIHNDRLFIVFSGSGCWTDHYALGLMEFTGTDNLLDSSQWKKYPDAVFSAAPENGVYAPGHNSFFMSPDGKEYWILYHANAAPGQGCGGFRSPRMQPFTWDENGLPVFGKPVAAGTKLAVPGN